MDFLKSDPTLLLQALAFGFIILEAHRSFSITVILFTNKHGSDGLGLVTARKQKIFKGLELVAAKDVYRDILKLRGKYKDLEFDLEASRAGRGE